jgi:heme/copper-type cytochrome/quinol oxidase subunit 2
MTGLFHWFAVNSTVLALLVTLGVAVLLICCLKCSDCSKRDKDDLFKRREV